MNKSLLIVIILTIAIPTYASQEEESKAVDALEKELLEKYKPSKERCGAAVHTSHHARVPDNLEAQTACMISGFKDVFWSGRKSFDKISKTHKDLLKKHNISRLVFQTGKPNCNDLILHTPAGKKNAVLLHRYLTLKPMNQQLLNELRKLDINGYDLSIQIKKDTQKEAEIDQTISTIQTQILSLAQPHQPVAEAALLTKDDVAMERQKNYEPQKALADSNPLIEQLEARMQEKNVIHQKLMQAHSEQKQNIEKQKETKQQYLPNEYLIGSLLGYDPKDIDYYYQTVRDALGSKREPDALKMDKKSAEEWITQQSEKTAADAESEREAVWYV